MGEQEMVCIVCPVGCVLSVRVEGEDVAVEGNLCPRGKTYARQEALCPMRTVTSSVLVQGGSRPLCAVKTKAQVPKASIPKVLEEIRGLTVAAPIEIGQVVCPNVGDTGVDLVATAEAR